MFPTHPHLDDNVSDYLANIVNLIAERHFPQELVKTKWGVNIGLTQLQKEANVMHWANLQNSELVIQTSLIHLNQKKKITNKNKPCS